MEGLDDSLTHSHSSCDHLTFKYTSVRRSLLSKGEIKLVVSGFGQLANNTEGVFNIWEIIFHIWAVDKWSTTYITVHTFLQVVSAVPTPIWIVCVFLHAFRGKNIANPSSSVSLVVYDGCSEHLQSGTVNLEQPLPSMHFQSPAWRMWALKGLSCIA